MLLKLRFFTITPSPQPAPPEEGIGDVRAPAGESIGDVPYTPRWGVVEVSFHLGEGRLFYCIIPGWSALRSCFEVELLV